MFCPKDSHKLEKAPYANVSLYSCSKCKGIWLEKYESLIDGDLIDRINQITKGEESAISCPRDRNALIAIDHAGIQIDICVSCHGVYLDHGELEKIAAGATEERKSDFDAADLVLCGLDVVDIIPLIIRAIGKAISAIV
jgi:Zn-finger nucleic acid-binding protein